MDGTYSRLNSILLSTAAVTQILVGKSKGLSSSEILIFCTAVLHFQLKEIPEDFFVDIVSRNNFLTATLQVRDNLILLYIRV